MNRGTIIEGEQCYYCTQLCFPLHASKAQTLFRLTLFLIDISFREQARTLSLSLFVLCTAARVVFQVSIGDSKIGK